MFRPSQNITRGDAIQSVMLRFSLSEDVAQKITDLYYPVAFWRVLSVSEYQKLIGEICRPSDKRIATILQRYVKQIVL